MGKHKPDEPIKAILAEAERTRGVYGLNWRLAQTVLEQRSQRRWPGLCPNCHFPEEATEFRKQACIAGFQGYIAHQGEAGIKHLAYEESGRHTIASIGIASSALWRNFAAARGDCIALPPGVCQCECHTAQPKS